jgi:hypothetical protein
MQPCVLVGQSVHLVCVSYPNSHSLCRVVVRLRPRRVSGDLDNTRSDGHLKEEAGWHHLLAICLQYNSFIGLLTLGLHRILCEAVYVMRLLDLNLSGI